MNPQPSPFTVETFAPYLNDPFTVRVDETREVVLELLEAEAKQLAPNDGRALGRGGFARPDPFSLLFAASPETPLVQRLYLFHHPILGDFEMSIVPVGPGGRGLYYEAVFN